MPRISKKRYNESNISAHSSVKTTNLKSSYSTNRGKKLKTVIKKLDDMEKTETSCKSLSRNLSTESIIYVGSYTLNEKYSLIDLTESITSIKSEEGFPISKYAKFSNCHRFYTNLVENCNLACTASTSHLLSSIDGPKLSLNKNAKSASCLAMVNEIHTSGIRNCDIPKRLYSLNKNKRIYNDQMVELQEEDQNMIEHSLEIEDDINILNFCSPQNIITDDIPVETLMKTYQVDGTDEFS